MRRDLARWWIVAGSAVALAGCSGARFLPQDGPDSAAIVSKAALSVGEPEEARTMPYLLANLEPRIVEALPTGVSLGPALPVRGLVGEVRPGVGDVLAVTIFEAGSGGLFTGGGAAGGGASGGRTSGANSVELPLQAVDARGNITVPYAGEIPAAGRSVREIQRTIEERLKTKAIEPQVIVSIREQRANQTTVLGNVQAPGQFPLNSAGLRVLDVIARAGGIRTADYETQVRIQRGGRSASVSFMRLVANPADNVYVRPGDTIYVEREPRSFVVIGAAGQAARLDFEAETLNLTNALGKGQGLLDDRADPSAVFVYRLENRAFLHRLGFPVAPFNGQVVPTIYRANLNEPQGYFLASQFQIRSGDVIYVGNAASVEVRKFFDVARSITQPARDIAAIRSLASTNSPVAAAAAVGAAVGQ